MIAATSHAGAVLDRVLHGLSPVVRSLAPESVAVAHHVNVPASLLTALALHTPGGSDQVFSLGRSLRNELKGQSPVQAANALAGKQAPQVIQSAKQLAALDKVPNPHAAHPTSAKPAAKATTRAIRSVSGLGPDAKVLAKADVKLSKRFGIPASVLFSQQKIESSLGANTGPSSAGARGDTQFIPSTRQMILDKYGVDAYAGPRQAARAQALLLRDSGYANSPQKAIFAYNHSQAYVNDVLSGAKEFGVLDKGVGHLPQKTISRFHAITQAAKTLDAANVKGKLPYSLGAGHVSGRVPGPHKTLYDCSSAVSYVLQHAGFLKQGAQVSGDFENFGKPGPGAVTIYANADHVFMKIGNRYFGTSHSNPGGGAGFIPKSYEQGEALSGNYVVRHVPGLDKHVAAALGIPTTTSAPGLSYGPGGTTATVTSGTFQDAAGVTSKPPVPRGAVGASGGSLNPMLTALLPAAYAGGTKTQAGQSQLADTLGSGVAAPRRRLSGR